MSITLPQNLNYNMPAVMFWFDDGLASLYTEAFAYMNPLGMKASAAIIPPPYLGCTEAQLLEMDAALWDMGGHTTSPVELTTMSEPDQETAIGGGKSYLDGLTLTRASSHVIYPTGSWNADTLTAMTNLGMTTGRATYNTRESMRYFDTNPFLLPARYVNAADTPASVIDWIECILCEGFLAVPLFHAIVASGATGNQYNRADFRAIVDWVAANHLPTLTITQISALRTGSIEYTEYW